MGCFGRDLPHRGQSNPHASAKIKKLGDFWAAQISQVRGELDANLRSILSFSEQKKESKKRF